MSRRSFVVLAWMLCAAGCASIPPRQDRAPGPVPAAIWRDPGDMSSLDLFYGSGGREHAPDAHGTFTFVKEDLDGTSPKLEVRDERGVEWKVKLGEEPQSETAATRFLWAAGYFVDDDYYLAELKLSAAPRLHRGRQFISKDGIVHGARLERRRPDVKKVGTWSWFDSPFVGTQAFNGLRTMMSFLNNWDMKAENNSIYEVVERGRQYVVSDIGATFGKTGSRMSGTQGSPPDYTASTFIRRTTPESVDFELRSRPFFILMMDFRTYIQRAHMQAIVQRIPRSDAQWIGRRLAQLSVGQIGDAFRAAGYSPADVDAFTRVVVKRIAALEAL